MTELDKLKHGFVAASLKVVTIDGFSWATNGHILLRLNMTADECGGIPAGSIQRSFEKWSTEERIPATPGSLVYADPYVMRIMTAGDQTVYIQERYRLLMRGEVFWLPQPKCFIGVEDNTITSAAMPIDASGFVEIAAAGDTEAELRYYREKVLWA